MTKSRLRREKTGKNDLVFIDAVLHYFVGRYGYSFKKIFTPFRHTMVSMPYVYLFQLARSKYGYPQYLKTDSPDKDKLLEFAFWRTQMCREVEQKASVISNELLKLL